MRQFTMNKLVGLRVHTARHSRKANTEQEPRLKRVGKVRQLVFSPDGCTVVGVLVKRPDVAGVVKRDDLFVALDALEEVDSGLLISSVDAASGQAAQRRLGLDWDRCIIWAGMDVKTEEGKELGYVTDVRFNADTGAVAFMGVSDGSTSQAIVGQVEIPSGMIKGYRDGWMIVDNRASGLELTGGLAGRAGEATARAKVGGRKAAAKLKVKGSQAGKKAAVTAEKGAFALGKQLGRTKDMFSEFKREFDKNVK